MRKSEQNRMADKLLESGFIFLKYGSPEANPLKKTVEIRTFPFSAPIKAETSG